LLHLQVGQPIGGLLALGDDFAGRVAGCHAAAICNRENP
jgi:hypothetical protein